MASPQLMSGLGAAAAIFFSAAGSAIASAHSGIFAAKASYSSSGVWIYAPILISGVLAIYGLIIGIVIQAKTVGNEDMDSAAGYMLLSSGLVVGLGCFSSGLGMSRFLDMYIKDFIDSQTVKADNSNTSATNGSIANGSSSLLGGHSTFVMRNAMEVTWDAIFSMVFLEAIALYSLIVALFLSA